MDHQVRDGELRFGDAPSSKLHLKPPSLTRRVKEGLPLVAVVSGGQTGADVAGVRAARQLGLATGGWAPRGWKTLDGAALWLGKEYGLVESGWDYAGRTSANVRDSDATVRFASNFCSTGERCTLKAITKWGKLYLDITIINREVVYPEDRAKKLVNFLVGNNVRVLNVAGNSEKTSPGIEVVVEKFLLWALSV